MTHEPELMTRTSVANNETDIALNCGLLQYIYALAMNACFHAEI